MTEEEQALAAQGAPVRGDTLAKKWTRPTVSRLAAGSAELGGDTVPEALPVLS